MDPADVERSNPVDDSDDAFDPLLRRAARLTPRALSPQHGLRPGATLCGGRFQIKRRIGSGGMGVVHEALDHERGRSVALKTLARLEAADVYRLKNEFRALAEVTHPNLIRLHELFADDGLWLFTMELIAGQPFDAWVRPGGQLDLGRLRAALAQLVVGVRAIHDAGKLHRDVKPNNVLVTDAGHVVILDFGLVADRDPGGAGQTVGDDAILGTPAYMAPELFEREAASSASDWYAVGVTLFEALTGRLPIEVGGDPHARRKRGQPAPRPSAIVADLPRDLVVLCEALLAGEPALRPNADAIALVLDAERTEPSVPVGATRSRPPLALLGRDAELAAFRGAYASARAGRPTLLRVTGESGIGKSALVGECLDEMRSAPDVVVLHGRCYERENVPYKAFDRVVDELTRYLRRLRDVEVASILPRDAAALARIFPVLGRVELVATSPAREAADDQELRRHAFDAFAELLAKIRDRRMFVLCIDDLQWLDHDSLLLIEHLLGQSELSPLLFIASYHAPDATTDPMLARVDDAARANPRIDVRDIALGPLAPESSRELARRLLGAACSRELIEAVAGEAQGSPFLIGELARHAVEAGEQVACDSMSLQRVVHSRAARLGETAIDILNLLAISGRPTPIDVLARAALAGADARHALDLLRAAHLVRDSGSRACACYHDRIRSAVAERIDREGARAFHLRLADAWSGRIDPDPEVLFGHCLAAEQRDQAARHAIEAAARAASGLAFERSAAFLGQAIELVPHADATRFNLQEQRAEALSLAGRWAEAAQAYSVASDQSAEPARHAELLRKSALHFLGSGRSAQGLPRLRRLFAIAGIHWPRTRAGALLRVLFALVSAWLWGVRRAPVERDTPLPAATREREASVLDRLLEGASCVPPYDYVRGLYFMTAFAQRALRSGETPHASVALAMLATVFGSMRPTRALARRMVDQACTMARTHELAYLRSAALTFSAWARLADDRLPEALLLSVEAGETLRSSGRMYIYEVWAARSVQSMALFAMGRVRDAVALFAANARMARELGDDMAVIGGDSVLRHLVADDLERAHALVEHKASLLPAGQSNGGLHDFVQVERMLCALYAGRGAESLQLRSLSVAFAVPEYAAMAVSCALQELPVGIDATRRAARRTVRRLRRRDRSAADRAMAAQFEGALCMMDGDVQGAAGYARDAAALYRDVNMALHAAVMQVRHGELSGDPEAKRIGEEARRWMLSEGIVRPDAWMRMLAPGF